MPKRNVLRRLQKEYNTWLQLCKNKMRLSDPGRKIKLVECGIAAEGEKVPENELNERLKQLLVAPKNAGMVLNTEEASAENIIEVESHNESNEEDELDYIQNGASDIIEGMDADDSDE